MARLYWRVKKNGKWTWVPLTKEQRMMCINPSNDLCQCASCMMEEE